MSEKQRIREEVWDALEESGEARFPYPPHGRIPNFAGAAEAADRLAALDVWQEADVIKSNPDAPQLPVRRAALHAGKTVYMAVPRLRDRECFLTLDPAVIADVDQAATIGGATDAGVAVAPGEMDAVDLIVSGSVAVNDAGARIGKGEGYSDLEFAILRECGLVDETTTTVTTVHARQVRDEAFPTTPHDVPMEWVLTPDQSTQTTGAAAKPDGLIWDALAEDRIAEIPILQELAP